MKTLQKLKATLLLSAALCLLCTQSYAQKDDGLIPSPEGQSTINRIQNPVNYYTGTVNIQAPLCSAEARGVSVPVSLIYTASAGVKVDDEATCVGLGWNLSAGGKITRIVKGHPDEHYRDVVRYQATTLVGVFDEIKYTQGWAQWRSNDIYTISEDLFQMSESHPDDINYYDRQMYIGRLYDKIDTEADIFYFEIPGASGAFVFDHDLKAYTLPYQDIKIEFLGNHQANQNYFIITDNSGNRYKFGTTDDSRELTATLKSVKAGEFRKFEEDLSYNTAWLLDEIQPFSGESITFSYKNSEFTPDVKQTAEYYAGTYTDDPSFELTGFDCYSSHYKHYPKYIDQITWSKGKITFSYGSMTDLRNVKYTLLTGINVFERNNKIKEFHLDYSSFGSSHNDYAGPKLDGVWELFGTDARQDIFIFDYYGPLNPPYRRTSIYQDHWGYFNEVGQYQSILPYIEDGDIKVNGHKKTPSLAHTYAGMLFSIKSANGETILYIYELNEIYNEWMKRNEPFGGLRIKEIRKKSGPHSSITTSRFEYKKADGTSSGMPYRDKYMYHNNEKVYSKCISPVYDFFGRHVYYSRVTEYKPNGSKVVYNFRNDADKPFKLFEDIFPDTFYHDRYIKPLCAQTSFAWRRGLLSSKEIYVNSKLVEKEEYKYSFGTPLKTIECYAPIFMSGNRVRLNIYRWICEPVILTKTSKTVNAYGPLSETTFTYDTNHIYQPVSIKSSDSDGNTYETRIKYSCNYTNIANSIINDKNSMVAAIKYMLGEKAVNIPIETLTYKNGKIVSGNIDYYKTITLGAEAVGIVPDKKLSLRLAQPLSENTFLQSRIYNTRSASEFQSDSRYKADIYYDEYDAERKLLSSHEENGPAKSIIYGYGNTLPVAAVTNAVVSRTEGKNQVIYDSFESGASILKVPHSKSGDYVLNGYYSVPLNKLKPGKYSVSYWRRPRTTSNRADWEYVERIVNINSTTPPFTLASSSAYVYDELRIIPVGARMTTYSYRPGIGKISETDSNGITVYYEYNKYGLLKAVKDTDGRVIKKIVYDDYTSNL